MTFFGYAVSDLTQSWLLYQGILFVLVMMYMPSGLTGLFGVAGRMRQRFGLVRLIPLALLSASGTLLLSAGGVFAVEILQRLFSQDYRAMARLNANGPMPAVTLFGHAWSPASMATWLLPVALLGLGALFIYLGRQYLASLDADRDEASAVGAAGMQGVGGIA
jgi:branched-chain amino acid transport system permease protein